MCWRRLLSVPWTARRSDQSVLKYSVLNTHWKDWCWNWSPSTLATWCEEPTDWKRLILGKIEGRRRRGQQRMRWLGGITDSVDMSLSKLWEIVKDRAAWRALVYGIPKSWTRFSDWTIATFLEYLLCFSVVLCVCMLRYFSHVWLFATHGL